MLMNFVALENDVPARLHFTDVYFVRRQIRDGDRGGFKWVESMVFQVDLLDGEPVFRTFSVLSQKLAAQLQPFVDDQSFMGFEFLITRSGTGFATEYRVQPIRISPAASPPG